LVCREETGEGSEEVRRRDKPKKNRDSERLSLPQLEQKALRKLDFGAGAEREFQEVK